jgi:iron complex outermembrane receptor protein
VHTEQDNLGLNWEKYEGEIFSYGLEDDIKFNKNLAFVLGTSYDLQKPKYADGGNLRDDDSSWNGQGGLVYRFENETKAHASVAKKTRFPTLNELYSSYLGTATPNPNLKKEQSTNYEVGLERPLAMESNVGLNIFYSDIKDLIVRTTVGGNNFYDNVGKARYQGFEFIIKTEYFPGNITEANYTYLDTEDKSPNPEPHIAESPKHKFYISDLFKINDLISLFAKAEYSKGQWQQKNNNDWVELDDYWTADLKAIAGSSEKTHVEFGVRNIFDKNYETAYGFPREGRTYFLGILGKF